MSDTTYFTYADEDLIEMWQAHDGTPLALDTLRARFPDWQQDKHDLLTTDNYYTAFSRAWDTVGAYTAAIATGEDDTRYVWALQSGKVWLFAMFRHTADTDGNTEFYVHAQMFRGS